MLGVLCPDQSSSTKATAVPLRAPFTACSRHPAASYVQPALTVPESLQCRATGPCGPCSELYYDFQPELGTAGASLEDDSRFIEFYNLVFMESNRGPDGSLKPLENRNIDTGMGLERVAQVRQTLETVLMSMS